MGTIVSTPAHHADATPATRTERIALIAAVVLPLLATIWAVVLLWNRLVGWQELVALAVFYVATASGIGVGFHRMLTHRSFEAKEPVRFFFLALGSMALQGPAIEWAATHHKHHAKSDKEGDPHSPLEGFWTAHMGWLFRDRMIKTGIWAKPYVNDRTAQFIDKTFVLWAGLSFVLPGLLAMALGGSFWLGVLWGGAVRLFLVHHITWSVNSVCHTFGRREFHSHDESRNEWVVGLLGLGEGWHNNHHAFPSSAIFGLERWQVDPGAWLLRGLEKLGWVWDVQVPTNAMLAAKRRKAA